MLRTIEWTDQWSASRDVMQDARLALMRLVGKESRYGETGEACQIGQASINQDGSRRSDAEGMQTAC